MLRQVSDNKLLACAIWVLLGFKLLSPNLSWAVPQQEPAAAVPVTAGAEQAVESPRSALKGFQEAIKREDVAGASAYLDFPRRMNAERKQMVTQELMDLINRKAQIDLAQVSDQATGRVDDGLLPDTEIVGRISVPGGAVPIEMRRLQVVGDERRIWRFSQEFVDRVPDLTEAVNQYNIEDRLPPFLTRGIAFRLKAWQWLGLGLALLLAIVTSHLVAYLLVRIINLLSHSIKLELGESSLNRFVAPLRWLGGLLVFRIARSFLELPLNVRQTFLYAENVAFVIFFSYLAMRLIEVGTDLARSNMERQGRSGAVSVVQPIRKGLKSLVGVVASLWVLRVLGFDVTAVLAGLGVGGLAVALAGQKTIENLFGGISVIIDQPVRVGDSGKFGDVIGTVEEIGLRSTKVRTLDRTILTIPNAEFSLMKLENYERRDKMRWTTILGLRYETRPDQMRLVLMRLKELLVGHPMVVNDPARVRFVRFAPSSLDVEIFCYLNTADVQVYWAIVEDLNLKIMNILDECGTGFAFPSTTLYVEQQAVFDREKQKEALLKAEAVAQKSGFPQPFYPPEWVELRADVLRFGPEEQKS